MVFRFGSSTSPNSLTIFEAVSHGDSGWEDDVCWGFLAAVLFWKTLQTTHSSYKSKHYKMSILNYEKVLQLAACAKALTCNHRICNHVKLVGIKKIFQ